MKAQARPLLPLYTTISYYLASTLLPLLYLNLFYSPFVRPCKTRFGQQVSDASL